MLRFGEMSDAELDRAVERHYDHLWDLYYGGEDAWDHYDPDWTAVMDILNGRDDEEVAQHVRDFIEGDGDAMTGICHAGLLESYIRPEEKGRMKDPDDEWKVVDRVFTDEWENDDLMVSIWENYEPVRKGVCEKLKEYADRGDADDIREEYNENKRNEAEAREEWEYEHRRRY